MSKTLQEHAYKDIWSTANFCCGVSSIGYEGAIKLGHVIGMLATPMPYIHFTENTTLTYRGLCQLPNLPLLPPTLSAGMQKSNPRHHLKSPVGFSSKLETVVQDLFPHRTEKWCLYFPWRIHHSPSRSRLLDAPCAWGSRRM